MNTLIKIKDLVPNEYNPRQELGDLTELTNSIKENGIMQQLTVVQDDKKYIVVIGHRRLAAAKEAGLKEVPCEIKELTKQEQVQIMLMENMQRSDLTITEQAKGIQMCLDLGIKEADIVKKTGLSKATISTRAKLNKFDLSIVQQKIDQGVTIDDFIKLSKIKEQKEIDRLLRSIGNSNFNWEFNEAYKKQETPKLKEKFLNFLKENNVKMMNDEEAEEDDSLSHEDCVFYPYDLGKIKDLVSKEGLVATECNDCFHFYLPAVEEPEESEDDEDNETSKPVAYKAKESKKKMMINSYFANAYELRIDFMKKFLCELIPSDMKQEIDDLILEELVKADDTDFWDNGYYSNKAFEKLFGISLQEVEYELRDELRLDSIRKSKNPLVLLVYTMLERADEPTSNWRDEFNEDEAENYKHLYNYITTLGYGMSDDEIKLIDGTHEVYKMENNGD